MTTEKTTTEKTSCDGLIDLEAESYATFTRTWWRWEYRNGTKIRVPGAGQRRYHGRNLTYEEARQMCDAWNTTHHPGPLSRKMEFEHE